MTAAALVMMAAAFGLSVWIILPDLIALVRRSDEEGPL